VGWLVRFVHNRHLAIENLVVACTRKVLIGLAPADVVTLMVDRLRSTNCTPSARSFLSDSKELDDNIKSKAGMFLVAIVPSRRNSKLVFTPLQVRNALEGFLTITRGFDNRKAHSTAVAQKKVTRMVAGIWINGDEWRQHHYCLYKPTDRRNAHVKPHVSVVECFFVFQIASRKVVFARVREQQILSQEGDMCICAADNSANPTKVIHVDCMLGKMMRVPHWTDEDRKIYLPTRVAL
jgi:hypothetical protein